MLLSISYDVLESLMINLVFDDDTVKKTKVSVNDVVKVTFNKNAVRTTIDGIVKRIFPDFRHTNRCIDHKPNWIMIIDGSSYGASAIERIEVDKILDIEMIKKSEESIAICSPVGDTNVTGFRLVGNILQLSTNNGESWLTVGTLPATDITIPAEDTELASKVEAILPASLRPDLKADLTANILNLVKEETKEDTSEDPQAETI